MRILSTRRSRIWGPRLWSLVVCSTIVPSAQAIAPSPSSQSFSVIFLKSSVGRTVYQYHWFPCVVYFSFLKYSEKGFVVHQTAREIHGAKRKGLSVKWILTYSEPSDDVEFQKTGSMALQTSLLLRFSLTWFLLDLLWPCPSGAHYWSVAICHQDELVSSSFVTDLPILYLEVWWPQLLRFSQRCWEPKKLSAVETCPPPLAQISVALLSLEQHLHRNPEGLF